MLGSRCVAVRGVLQNVDNVIHVVAKTVEDLTPLLAGLHDGQTGKIESLANADEVRRPVEDIRHKIKPASRLQRLLKEAPELRGDYARMIARKQARSILPKGRNFH